MTEASWSLRDVNDWDRPTFVSHLGFLFEQSPWIADAVWPHRPFATCDALHRALVQIVIGAEPATKVTLIRAHPDLVGRAALAGTLTRESTSEQLAAGLDPGRLAPDEVDQFRRLNAEYQTRFGFPFVICARDNTKDTILTAFTSRVTNDRSTEIETALAEIANIAWYRLINLVQCEP